MPYKFLPLAFIVSHDNGPEWSGRLDMTSQSPKNVLVQVLGLLIMACQKKCSLSADLNLPKKKKQQKLSHKSTIMFTGLILKLKKSQTAHTHSFYVILQNMSETFTRSRSISEREKKKQKNPQQQQKTISFKCCAGDGSSPGECKATNSQTRLRTCVCVCIG